MVGNAQNGTVKACDIDADELIREKEECIEKAYEELDKLLETNHWATKVVKDQCDKIAQAETEVELLKSMW